MNAWILFIWIAASDVGSTLTTVDAIESKEACEKLLADLRQTAPYAGAIRKASCTSYKLVAKTG